MGLIQGQQLPMALGQPGPEAIDAAQATPVGLGG
jgi:hypothetical protein